MDEDEVQNYLTVTDSDVRNFLLDRSISDNIVDLDLSFSAEEIANARRSAIRHYNAFPPQDVDCNISAINDPHIYMLGICYYLHLSKFANLSRNHVEYTAGGMTASLSGTRLKTYQNLIQLYKSEFENAASSRKKNINIMGFYGRIG